MKKKNLPLYSLAKASLLLSLSLTMKSCGEVSIKEAQNNKTINTQDTAEYFQLRPELEKKYGYTQAVKVGNLVKVGGVISIDDEGKPVAQNNYEQQMKNCYASLSKVLQHYGCTFDDVILENIYTTSMAELQKNAVYRQAVYPNHFPTGSWIGINELGMPGMMIEIEIEALVPAK